MLSRVFTRLLVGWDGSPGATSALRMALRLAASNDAQLTALAVVPAFAHVEDLDERRQVAEGVRAPLRAAFEAVVEEDVSHLSRKAVLEFVEAADVVRVFDRYAATHPPDLVVLGLHGQEGLLHPKMGHIASHAVQSSRCPVLVVPEPGTPASYLDTEGSAASRFSSLFHPFHHH